jgi:hypothetical protein
MRSRSVRHRPSLMALAHGLGYSGRVGVTGDTGDGPVTTVQITLPDDLDRTTWPGNWRPLGCLSLRSSRQCRGIDFVRRMSRIS